MVKTTSKTEAELKWWGYRHVEGSIHVKRYFDDRDIGDAWDSDFVQMVTSPFAASNRAEALTIASRILLGAE